MLCFHQGTHRGRLGKGEKAVGKSSCFTDSRETRGPGEAELSQAVDVESQSPRLLGLAAHNLWLRVVLRAVGGFSCIHMMLTVYQHLIAFSNPIK